MSDKLPMARRFRGFLPVVIDVECGGFNPNTDALLEIAAVLLEIQEDGSLKTGEGFIIPPGVVHNARNTGSANAKVLATYVVEKGKPMATPAK